MKTKFFLSGLAIIATTALISAQTPANKTESRQCSGKCQGSAYVDNNKDGVCDNYSTRKNLENNKNNRKCSGTCQNSHKGKGKRHNFVDANKNGVCDNHEARTKK